ncbi:hypothetical protein [Streptomyces kebangsaanensis]|uniref:hypothetical protein n=1 Tax=Streptomyces kebangsaanensis TaxID=864058 RepID=UPI00093AE3B7|nr:hypothetical protein [Streptomyces kebangsaanensis]
MTEDRPHIIDDLPALAAASRSLMLGRIAEGLRPVSQLMAIAHPQLMARAIAWETHRQRYFSVAAAIGVDEDTARTVLDAVVEERRACDIPTEDAEDVFAEARRLLHTLSYDAAHLTGQAPDSVRSPAASAWPQHPTIEQTTEMLARIRALHTGMVRTYVAAARPFMDELARALAALTATVRNLQEAGVIDEIGKPARRRDRPAWQSPYGPPRRRH